MARNIASPPVRPKPKPKPKSTVQKIGGAIKGAVDGAINSTRGTTLDGKPMININPVAPIVGAINGGIAGYNKPSNPAPMPLKPAPDRANDMRRSTGSGPEMKKTMPAPRNYGGIQAQPMPFIPGPNSGKAENMPFIPGKTPGKIENMPFKPESPKLKPAKPFKIPQGKMGRVMP